MSDSRLDLVTRESGALKKLEALVAERSEVSGRIEADRLKREVALEQGFARAFETLKSRYEAAVQSIDQKVREIPAQLQAEYEATKSQADRTWKTLQEELKRKVREEQEASKQKQSERRWEAGTVCEAEINAAKEQQDRAIQKLAALETQWKSVRTSVELEVQRFLKLDQAEAKSTSDASEAPPGEPFQLAALEERLSELEASATDLAQSSVSKLIRWGPATAIVVTLAVLGAVGGYFGVGSAPGAAIGLGSGLLVGLITLGFLYLTAKSRAQRIFLPFSERAEAIRSDLLAARKQFTAEYQARERDQLQRRDREHERADDRCRRELAEARGRYEAETQQGAETHRVTLENAAHRRDDGIAQVQEEAAKRLPELKQKYEQELAALKQKREQQREENARWLEAASTELRNSWRTGLSHVRDELNLVADVTRVACPPYESRDWRKAESPAEVPPAIRFGELSVNLEMFPGGPPDDPSLMDGLPRAFEPPALLRCPDGCSIVLKSAAEGRDQAIQTLQALMLRLASSLPPGKARFTIIDPVGLGENFSAFMHLADYDEQLVTSRIWTEAQHIEQRLVDLTEHMENVIQKYLRNEYRSIMEYNEKAGEVAEPFRFLVVADFPVRFNEAAARRLLSIAASGARCGVFVLVSVDTRQEMPQGIDLRDLEKHAAVLTYREGRYRWNDPVLGGFPLKLDSPPAREVFTHVVQAVGEKAQGASRVEVPFEFIAPSAGNWWSKDSRSGIDVPLGQAGATKTQNLKLGQGTSQHVLIAGKTGSGKSTLLHILITNTAMNYSPDEVELYLVDFKKGVEFKTYATHRLPHARVIAVESEREFGLSVLQRLDEELKERGDLFRSVGAQDLAGYRAAAPDKPMPRILLIVDEFQEFFVEDDKIGQEAALLLDRLVRQGRAFGIHVHLGSQTLAGAYTLARATIGQMAVRIALQCSEADASLILSDENTAARLLSRPGEAIYNDANGRLEGNNFFQVVWLRDNERENYLRRLSEMAVEKGIRRRSQVIFEGNVTPEPENCESLMRFLKAPSWPEPPKVDTAWLGEPVAIKDHTAMVFRRQGGSHLLIVGQSEEFALGLEAMAMISLAAQRAETRFAVLDGTPADSPFAGLLETVARKLPQSPRVVGPAGSSAVIEEVALELQRRQEAGSTDEPPVFLWIHDLQRFRDLRKAEDDYGFSSRSPDEPVPGSERLSSILRDGPLYGVHAILWCDSLNSLNRALDRGTVRELETRVLFQMSAGDSSTLIDSPAANRLGPARALLVNEVQGLMEKFRPFGPPSSDWLGKVGKFLAGRPSPEEAQPAPSTEPLSD